MVSAVARPDAVTRIHDDVARKVYGEAVEKSLEDLELDPAETDFLRRLRNDISWELLLEQLRWPHKQRQGQLAFLCPRCHEYLSAVNPRTTKASILWMWSRTSMIVHSDSAGAGFRCVRSTGRSRTAAA